MAIQDVLNQIMAQVNIPDLGKNLTQTGFIKSLRCESGKAELIVEIPVSLRHLRNSLKAECENKLKAVEGVSEADVIFKFQVQKTSSPEPAKKSVPSLSGVKNIIAIASGKGGVGKSTVTANLAAALKSTGAKVGVMDLDIYGPSMNLMFGINESPQMDSNKKLFPVSCYGINVVSMAMFTDENSAVIWRGPMVSQMVQNFLSNVNWGVLDYLLLDLPPGTGDIQLTLTQMAPLTGALIVTTPQEVSLLDAKRGLKMFEKVSVPVLGIVENMSVFIGDDGKEYHIFQKGGGLRIANSLGVPFCGEIPLDPAVSRSGDEGKPIVLKDPNCAVSKVYEKIALTLQNRLEFMENDSDFLFQYDYSWENLPRVAV